MTITREDLDAGRVDLLDVVTGETIPPVSPGEVLREEFLVPMGLSAKRLAAEIGVPTNRITSIINGTRAVTAETAILLARRFGNSPEFWLGLQVGLDLERARQTIAA
ncbi:HigA family addiction module antitoxin [Roseomonas chloroacetimidivorans]|uniref:HigA family addiction module antitoxin n=1 Tax=Roseomonas chloroacetimidivorans TaxID=1766656 RepID=UPI003C761184